LNWLDRSERKSEPQTAAAARSTTLAA